MSRFAEASDRGSRAREHRWEGDSFTRTCDSSGAVVCDVADERIPGRVTFDLYLVRSNRQARASECLGVRPACERPGDRDNDRESKSGADRWRPAGESVSNARLVQVEYAAASRLMRVARVVITATRRGSVIDVLG